MTEAPPSPANLATPAPVIPVSLLNRMARERLESAFPLCWVAGEISNLTYAASGHVYFTLKDAQAQVRCVMYRNRAQLLGWRLANGQRIEARVLVTLYEARGDFQLNVENARQAGTGNLYEEFLRRKARLDAEGLFAPEHKRDLPAFPRRIGLITSPQAAALRDALTTLRRRAPQVGIVLYPTPVQGAGAAREIVAALRVAGERKECDLLILCRGGGSLEDLWEFNDEALARAIRACPLPVISGVGHETDFTLADFAADCRAPTPTAAAELAAPARESLLNHLLMLHAQLHRQTAHRLEQYGQRLDLLAHRLQHPAQRLAAQTDRLNSLQHRLRGALAESGARGRRTLADLSHRLLLARPECSTLARRLATLPIRLDTAWQQRQSHRAAALTRLSDSLEHLNPQNVLGRGYSIVSDGQGSIVRDSRTLEPNDVLLVSFHSGHAQAQVTSTRHAQVADL